VAGADPYRAFGSELGSQPHLERMGLAWRERRRRHLPSSAAFQVLSAGLQLAGHAEGLAGISYDEAVLDPPLPPLPLSWFTRRCRLVFQAAIICIGPQNLLPGNKPVRDCAPPSKAGITTARFLSIFVLAEATRVS